MKKILLSKWSSEKKFIASGFGIAILIICIVSTISLQYTTQLFKGQKQIEHSYQVIQAFDAIINTLRDAERARRGYIITSKELYLETYNNAFATIDGQFNYALNITANNDQQQKQLAIIAPLITKRLALIKKSIELHKQDKSNTAEQIALTDRGILLHDQIWHIITEIETQEKSLLERSSAESAANYKATIFMVVVGSGCTFLLLFAVYLLLHHQIVKRRRTETILRESKRKTQFFSMISHEFRTPLSTILISAQVLENCQEYSEAKKLKNLQRIQSAAKNMTQLITDILTLTRAEAGLDFQPKSLDIEKLCDSLIEDIEFSSGAKQNIFFISECQTKFVNVDEKMLRSIINNLVYNAIKYSPDESDIYFTLSGKMGQVILQIQDQGIGIDLEEQKYIYEAFYRSKKVADLPGTGLGLAVVNKCVELHGGSITLASQVGVGSTFTVKIPKN
ncbi:MAG: CHASE3 domain-containing protein [Nostocaceae cyanobacterium]|nr:CHASE3 domain-containing protein [Nostocaceae cyanobacterium]